MCQVGNQSQKELELLGAIANFRKEEKVAEMEKPFGWNILRKLLDVAWH